MVFKWIWAGVLRQLFILYIAAVIESLSVYDRHTGTNLANIADGDEMDALEPGCQIQVTETQK